MAAGVDVVVVVAVGAAVGVVVVVGDGVAVAAAPEVTGGGSVEVVVVVVVADGGTGVVGTGDEDRSGLVVVVDRAEVADCTEAVAGWGVLACGVAAAGIELVGGAGFDWIAVRVDGALGPGSWSGELAEPGLMAWRGSLTRCSGRPCFRPCVERKKKNSACLRFFIFIFIV